MVRICNSRIFSGIVFIVIFAVFGPQLTAQDEKTDDKAPVDPPTVEIDEELYVELSAHVIILSQESEAKMGTDPEHAMEVVKAFQVEMDDIFLEHGVTEGSFLSYEKSIRLDISGEDQQKLDKEISSKIAEFKTDPN